MTQKIALIAILLTLNACASMFNERTQKINVVTSTGEKADVLIDGMPFEAPGVATILRAKADKVITAKDPKCNPSTLMPSTIDNVFWINLLSAGVFGSTTDYSTEKMWKYQDTVTISCKG